MTVKLVSSGGGSVAIIPPNTASDYTLTAPAVTANIVTSTTGTVNIAGTTAARVMTTPDANISVDYLTRTGNVLQVVSSGTTTYTETTSTSPVDTTLSATITPLNQTVKF